MSLLLSPTLPTRDVARAKPSIGFETPLNASSTSIAPQATGQSTTTLDAAYDSVFSQLDALANTPLTLHDPTPPAATAELPDPFNSAYPSTPFGRNNVSRLSVVSERTEISTISSTTTSPSPHEQPQLGAVTTGGSDSRLSRRSVSPNATAEQAVQGSPRTRQSSIGSSGIVSRFPLPPSPVKGPRGSPSGSIGTPQSTPKKAMDLIRMFENQSKGGSAMPPPPQPSFAPAALSRTAQMATTGIPIVTSAPIPTAATGPQSSHVDTAPEPTSQENDRVGPNRETQFPLHTAHNVPPTPPSKSPSPLSQVRTMIASWRARSGSPDKRVIGSPGKSGDGPGRLFGRDRDRGWNVSIRRRRRNDDKEEAHLAEATGDEPETSARETSDLTSTGPGSEKTETVPAYPGYTATSLPSWTWDEEKRTSIKADRSDEGGENEGDVRGGQDKGKGRDLSDRGSPSIRSAALSVSSRGRILSGEVSYSPSKSWEIC